MNSSSGIHKRHGEEHCCVVAFFDKDKECYNMRTIGDRFFEDKDAWIVGKYGSGISKCHLLILRNKKRNWND
jgi:hypothetical protein